MPVDVPEGQPPDDVPRAARAPPAIRIPQKRNENGRCVRRNKTKTYYRHRKHAFEVFIMLNRKCTVQNFLNLMRISTAEMLKLAARNYEIRSDLRGRRKSLLANAKMLTIKTPLPSMTSKFLNNQRSRSRRKY